MHRHLARTSARLERLLRHRIEPHVLWPRRDLEVAMSAPRFEPHGEPGDLTGVTPPVRWGPAWHTTWFQMTGTLPHDWADRCVVAHVDLGFRGRGDGFQVEGLVWQEGRLRHALQPDRRTVVVTDAARGGETIELWIEAASNPVMADDPADLSYRPTVMGDPTTSGTAPLYTLRRAEVAVVNPEVEALGREVQVMLDLLADLPEHDPWVPWLEQVSETVIAAVDLDDVVGSAPAARAALASVFRRVGAPDRHRVVAVGHAHLDTAWLWPVREARRKARRTFANVADLADRFPDFRFAHSQAQHWAWIREDDPELFERLSEHVAAGRVEPVGGMWVEADLNLSGGEALVRQFLHGQHAFHQWFGRWCEVGFLPDDFGYPAAFPQLLRGAGCRGFFTQKLSWNETNRFPHHTFWWEGLDGSRVLTHFSPIETYNALVMPSQLRFASRNFADHALSDRSLMCFGHGDGGGGPTADMIERVRLLADVDGLPMVQWGRVDQFFADLDRDGERLATWAGEIVLEKHRGTYTSQVATKQGNVLCERLLREAEMWSVAAGDMKATELRRLWERLLVEQFHDILPGSSIAWVHADAEHTHAEVAAAARRIIEQGVSGDASCVANPAPVGVNGVVIVDGGVGPVPDGVQVCADGTWAANMVMAPLQCATWSQVVRPVARDRHVQVDTTPDGSVRMDNGLLQVTIDRGGRVTELIDLAANRRVLRPDGQGARLVLHPDQPAEYDAWDIDQPDARRPPRDLPDAVTVEVVDDGPLVGRVRCTHHVGATTVVHDMCLPAGAVRVDHVIDAQWHQSEQRLAYVVPVDVAGTEATVGVQFGHVRRARHTNTSWQAAQFEQVAHRWVHVGETRFGVALLFTGARGVDVNHPDRHLGLSLLRSSRYPDPRADRGQRGVRWAMLVTGEAPWGDGLTCGLEVEAQRLQHPPHPGGRVVPSLVRHALRGVMVETLKAPHPSDGESTGSTEVILRLWESEGARVSGTVRVAIPGTRVQAVERCDLLERSAGLSLPVQADGFEVTVQPFEVVTLRVRLQSMADSRYGDR